MVRQPDGQVAIDPKGKIPGRGAYLCMSRACWAVALDRRRLGAALKAPLTEEQRAELAAFAATLPAENPELAAE